MSDGTIYYVDPQPATSGSNVTKLALYSSRAQIGTGSTIQVGLGVSEKDLHTFTLLRQQGKKDKCKYYIEKNSFISKFD